MRLLSAAALVAAVALSPVASADAPPARVDARLLHLSAPSSVFVHGTTLAAAEAGARHAGLRVVERYRQVGIVLAVAAPGTPSRAAAQAGVTYVEDADAPIALADEQGDRATRADQARSLVKPVPSGAGIGVAVIDTGIDGTHPFFQTDHGSKVTASYKELCTDLASLAGPPPAACWQQDPTNNTDTLSAGGHGTHVAGIVAGTSTTVTPSAGGTPRTLSGVAPGATLVSLSIGFNLKVQSGASAMNWVLEHHQKPCGAGASASTCPPIRVVNNSWGPVGGSAFDPESALAKTQRALVDSGIVVVWAAGNDGGDGSGKDTTTPVKSQLTNGPGNDPTPGVLMVGAYDGQTGSSDATVAYYSSRGVKGQPGTYPDLVAPGSDVLSSCRPTLEVCSEGLTPYDAPGAPASFNLLSGTSMATPYVSGAVAALLSLDPRMTPADVERVLEDGAHRFGDGYEPDPTDPRTPTSFDKGHGLVDLLASADLVQKRTPRAFPKPTCGAEVWADPAGDANEVELVAAGPDHPEADLRSGALEWDGKRLVVVVRVTELGPAGRGTGEDGTYVNADVLLDGDTKTITFAAIVRDGRRTAYANYTGGGSRIDLPVEVKDNPAPALDEVRIPVTDKDLDAFGPDLPVLASGTRVLVQRAVGGWTTIVLPVFADHAVGACPVVLR